jgi:hypothetical protein
MSDALTNQPHFQDDCAGAKEPAMDALREQQPEAATVRRAQRSEPERVHQNPAAQFAELQDVDGIQRRVSSRFAWATAERGTKAMCQGDYHIRWTKRRVADQ